MSLRSTTFRNVMYKTFVHSRSGFNSSSISSRLKKLNVGRYTRLLDSRSRSGRKSRPRSKAMSAKEWEVSLREQRITLLVISFNRLH